MTDHLAFVEELRARIDRHYYVGKYDLGWRLLYSPPAVIEGARLAFVGLNPGGRVRPDDHSEFAMSSGSAFTEESWKGCPPGQAPLQQQALRLFAILGQKPEAVLAGNLVPFRSPSWGALPGDKGTTVKFGQHLWRDIIHRARPSLVVTCGARPFDALHEILRAMEPRKYELGWGHTSARRCVFAGGELIGLPHLSRFPVITSRRDYVLRLLRGHIDE